MKNQVYTGVPTSRRFAYCPTTVKAGDAVLLGNEPAFALDDYQANTGGTTFCLSGTFTATVIGESVISPQTQTAINPGDQLYAKGTAQAAQSNGLVVTTGLTICSDTGGTKFGHLDPSYTQVAAGATDTVAQVQIP